MLDNILVDIQNDYSFICVICDFGCANVIGGNDVQNGRMVRGLDAPQVMGITAKYASPELFEKFRERDNKVITEMDKKVDIYAYTITLFEIMTRLDPWPNMKVTEIQTAVLRGKRPEIPKQVFESFTANCPNVLKVIYRGWDPLLIHRPSIQDIRNLLLEEVEKIMKSEIK